MAPSWLLCDTLRGGKNRRLAAWDVTRPRFLQLSRLPHNFVVLELSNMLYLDCLAVQYWTCWPWSGPFSGYLTVRSSVFLIDFGRISVWWYVTWRRHVERCTCWCRVCIRRMDSTLVTCLVLSSFFNNCSSNIYLILDINVYYCE